MAESEGASLYQDPALYQALLGADGADIPYYMRLAQGAPRVLDLACGSGRLSLPLAGVAASVFGLDLSAPMLALARSQDPGGRVAWLQADLRAFELPQPVDLAILSYNGLQHLHSREDLASFFACLRRALKPGGRFALDLHLPQAALLARDPDEWFGVDVQAGAYRVSAERSAYDPVTQVLTQTWLLHDTDGHERQVRLGLRQVYPQEIRLLLETNGFKVLNHDGGFEGQRLGAASLKQVLIAQQL